MKFVFAIFFCFLTLTLYSQEVEESFNVTGKVMDADSHLPLQFVSLTLQDINAGEIYGDITNKKGEFSLTLPKGKYYFIAESLSFKPYIINILKIEQDLDLGTIELQQHYEKLKEVEVFAKDKLIEYQANKKVYNASKDIANIGGSAITVLENTPSITVNEEGRISVRGNTAQVLVNGKPYGGSQNNADILSIIPASSIKKVEVMSRSAKYDAQGGEIINIVLKKGKNNGYNGTIEGHIGLPDNDGISAFINHKTDKINMFGTVSFNHSVKLKDISLDQTYLDNNQNPESYYDQIRDDYQQRNAILLNLGSEFYLDSLNSITISLLYTNSDKNYNANLFLNDYQPPNSLRQTSERLSLDNTDENLMEAFLNYTKKFNTKGHQLSFHLNYDRNISNSENYITQTEISPNNSDYIQDITKDQEFNNYYFKIDYALPLKNNAKFEAGHKSDIRIYNNDFSLSEQTPISQLLIGPYTNQIDYKENIYAFYANFSKEYDKFSYSLGLRTEISNTQIDDDLNLTNFTNNYNYWFPSASLNYYFEDNSSISAYYAPYVTRPTIKELNPFNLFTDERFQQMGNPFLQPYYTHYYLIEYHKDWNTLSLNTAAYYTSSKDGILNVLTETNDQTPDGYPIYRRFPINIGDIDYTGIELELTYMPTNKFRVYTFFSPFITKLSNTPGKAYDYTNTVYSARLMAQYKFTNTFRIQLNGTYQSSLKTAINELDAITYFNGTVSKDILEGKATITFRVNDIFHSKEFIYKSLEANTLTNRNAIYDTQYLLSFSYRFNKASRRNSHNRAKEVNKNIFEIEEGN